jgi:hypothetical protein
VEVLDNAEELVNPVVEDLAGFREFHGQWFVRHLRLVGGGLEFDPRL